MWFIVQPVQQYIWSQSVFGFSVYSIWSGSGTRHCSFPGSSTLRCSQTFHSSSEIKTISCRFLLLASDFCKGVIPPCLYTEKSQNRCQRKGFRWACAKETVASIYQAWGRAEMNRLAHRRLWTWKGNLVLLKMSVRDMLMVISWLCTAIFSTQSVPVLLLFGLTGYKENNTISSIFFAFPFYNTRETTNSSNISSCWWIP